MLIVADKQILCSSCGALVGLAKNVRSTPSLETRSEVIVKDQYVVIMSPKFYFCNIKCKERAQV